MTITDINHLQYHQLINLYCDIWDIQLTPPDYTNYLVSNSGIKYRALTTSFTEFLERFITSGTMLMSNYVAAI